MHFLLQLALDECVQAPSESLRFLDSFATLVASRRWKYLCQLGAISTQPGFLLFRMAEHRSSQTSQ